jgi:hypothetical protein
MILLCRALKIGASFEAYNIIGNKKSHPLGGSYILWVNYYAVAAESSFLHFSSGVAPQKLQFSPSVFKNGL